MRVRLSPAASAAALAVSLLGFSPLMAQAQVGPEDLRNAPRGSFEDLVLEIIRQNPGVVLEALNSLAGGAPAGAAALAGGRPALAAAAQPPAPPRPELAGPDVIATKLASLHDEANAIVYGNPDAPHVIVEFFDYRCGFCRQVHPVVEQVLAQRPDVKIIARQFPILGPDSIAAARVALAARKQDPAAAFAVHKAFLTHPGPYDVDTLVRVAATHGLDEARLRADVLTVDGAIEAEHVLAQSLGISGTPAFVFGDMSIMPGARPLPVFLAAVDQLKAHNATHRSDAADPAFDAFAARSADIVKGVLGELAAPPSQP